MKRSSGFLIAVSSLGLAAAMNAAEATAPVDYTQRNAPFAPASSVNPERSTPAIDRSVQDRRVEKATLSKPAAVLGERRAAIDVVEGRDKTVRETDARKPEVVDRPTSALDRRAATISTATDVRKPTLVSKYQYEMAAASAYTMASYPAVGGATTAKINRFVFRKNNPEPPITSQGGVVTPVAGGSSVRK
jgi:hypothetical protein